MRSIDGLFEALDEVAISRNVGNKHDETRARYSLRRNTVSNFNEFSEVLSNYYAYHIGECVIEGGRISKFEAAGKAIEIIEREYRKQGGNLQSVYKDASEGLNGGVRVLLDRLAETLKQESVERYVQYIFHQHVDPTSWPEKVEIMRQFINRFRYVLGSAFDERYPERYAQNYDELIKAFVDGLKRTSRIFRRF